MATVTKKITLAELRELTLSGKYRIKVNSADGFVPLKAIVDSGIKPSLRINGIGASTTHPFEVVQPDGAIATVLAGELKTGDLLLGQCGHGIPVESIVDIGEQNLLDVSIDHVNHRFYAAAPGENMGVSVHNCFNDALAKSLVGSTKIKVKIRKMQEGEENLMCKYTPYSEHEAEHGGRQV